MKFATKLTLLFSGFYIAASVFLISYIYLFEVNTLKEKITHRIEDQAFNTMDKIDQRLFDGLNDIKTLAHDQVIRSRSSTPQQIREKLLEFQAIQRVYASVSFFDLNRLRIADTSGKGVGTHSSLRDYWLDLARGETLVLNLQVSHTPLVEASVHFVCIVKDHNGIPFGVVVARMPLEEIQRIAEKTAGAHKTAENLKMDLVDREGVLLYSNYNKKGLFKDKACDWEIVNKKIAAGEKIGSVTYFCPEHHQEEIVIFVREQGYQNFSGNDWTLITYAPAGEAFAPAKALRHRLIVISLVIAVFSLLGISLFSRRITRPIVALEQAITAFGAGKLERAVPVASQDEVGSLATGGLSPSASLTHGKWEIGSLTQAFDNMVTIILQQEIKRTQAENELKLRAQLLDAASDSIFLHDLDGHFIYVNEAAYKNRGYEKEELLAKHLKVLPTPEFAEKREQLLKELSVKGEVIFESAHRRKDGSVMPVEIHARTIDLDNRQLILSVARDITERKQAETAWRESEVKYRTLIETTDTGYLILDSQGKVIDANKEYVRLSGHISLEEILGRSVAEWTAEHDRERNAAEVIKCLQQGYVRGLEIDYVDEEGRITPIEINATVITTGQSFQIVSLCRDITERKQAEENLRTAAAKWRTTFDAIGDAVSLLDLDCRIIQCNQAMMELVGKPYSEIIGGTCWEVMYGAAGPIDGCPLVRMNQSRQRETLTLPLGDRWLHVMVDPVLNEAGEVTGAVQIIADITKIKRTEETLRQSQEKLLSIFRAAPVGIGVVVDRVIQEANDTLCRMTGYALEELMGQNARMVYQTAEDYDYVGREKYRQIARRGSGTVETRWQRRNGDIIDILLCSTALDATDLSKGVTFTALDITDRKRAEEARQVSHRFLEIANRHTEMTPLLQEFVEEVQKTMQCQAVAIRVLDAEANIPYQAYLGFSREFYELESSLSIKRDECMCINVIKGTTDPQLPFYTPGGSFYINGTTRFLATVSEEGKGRTSNACNQFGYESVALAPIRLGDHILGLIHLADPRENMVPLPRVEQLEGIAQQLGAAMQRISSKAALEQLHRQYELILNSAWEGIMGLDRNGNHTFVNPAAARMLGYEVGELIGRHSHSTWHHTRADGSPYPAEECPIYEAFQKRSIQHMTNEHFIRKDGSSFVVEAISTPIKENGDISGTVVTFWDITQRKQGEKALKDSLEKMQTIVNGTVKALASAVETRDPYTAGHQIRVATLASAIAGEMGLSADQIEGIKIAAILHDIGKIGVPAEILSKPGRLSDTEYSLIKGHPQAGCEIFAGIDFPFPVTQIVAQHHERLDGSGYPCGLKSHDIILGARILAVADVVEAMASHRPYRPALGIEAALEEINKNKGILYDPEVAEACTKLFQEKGYIFD